jgi:hypothetical protein
MKDKHIFKSLVAAFLSLCYFNNVLNTNAMQPYCQENIKKSYNNDGDAFKFNFANNFLVIADTKERMQKVTSLLCNNNLYLSLGNLKQDFNNYQSGRVYKTLNNPNINVLCITLDDFINNSFDNYNWDFICQNTSKIFYIFKCDSTHDEKSFEKLQKFYHKFNKHWCGDDFAYNENYDPDFNSIWEPNFSKKPLAKGRNDWFEYIRVKRGLDDHRYIVFVLDNNKINYPFKLGHYVSKMPDARSINTKELNVDFNIKVLLDALRMEYYGTPQKVIPFNNDNIKKMSLKKIGLITAGGVGAIGMVTAISALIKKKLSEKPKAEKQDIKKPENNKLLT